MSASDYYLGIMSGTSLDGIDTALAAFAADGVMRLIGTAAYPMPDSLKADILQLSTAPAVSLKLLGQTDRRIADLFAASALQLLDSLHIAPAEVRAIGSHGQTIWHQPDGEHPFTLQIGDAHRIARLTGIDTIADFRRKDMAAGGQGAPLVPAFHRTLIASGRTAILLNIGGIANISVLRPNSPTLGFDTGPGNMLMDYWNTLHRGTPFDENAVFAAAGRLNASLLAQLLDDPYLSRPAPKSTGREHYSPDWLRQQLKAYSALAPEDIQRTLLEYTAISIADAVRPYYAPDALLIRCGGGSKNPLLTARLQALLPEWQHSDSRACGIDADYMEAIAFAWLAWRHCQGLAGNLPEATGAAHPVILGAYHPAN